MITLLRWLLLKQKEIKWKLLFYSFLDKELKSLMKNPEEIEKKFVNVLAELIHSDRTE